MTDPNPQHPDTVSAPSPLRHGVFRAVWVASMAVYVANFCRHDAIYGSAAIIIVILIWPYLSALVILAEAQIDVIWTRRASVRQVRTVAGTNAQSAG